MRRFAVTISAILSLVSVARAALEAPELVSIAYTPCAGMICVPVTLADGKSHVLLLDTGNVNSWLLADTARSIGLKPEPIEQDGKTLPGLFRLGEQKVSLQGQELSGRFLALSRQQTGELPPDVEGALAYPLFKDRILQIDYAHLVMRLLASQPAAAKTSGSELKFITFGKQGPPIVVGSGFRVNGKAVNAQFDTCYTGTLVVYTTAIDRLALGKAAGEARSRPKYFPYTDGGVNMNEATGESIAFGSYVLAPRPAVVYFPAESGNPVHEPDGLFEATVGNALFVHSVVTLDFHSMRITVQPG
jgi:hypothetical protein